MTRPRRLISFDWAMKRLLRSKAHFGILEGFLSELLREEIQILEVLESESNKDTAFDKQNRVDLKARNAGGEIILIEVQYQRQFDYLQRILHSTARTVVENLQEGQPYGEVVKVISVSILYFDLGQGQDYVYHGATRFIGVHQHDELQLSQAQRDLYGRAEPQALFPEYYLIKVNQFDDVARDCLDEWIYFLKHEEVPDGFRARGLQEAKEQLDILKLPEAERRAYERYQDDLHQQASMVQSSYGWGMHQGRQLGREEVREEGQQQERLRIARSLLGTIADDGLLAEKTGLDEAQVRGLREEQG
ncbi:Rpn family recombination-promoting nuclease/putative transposase [uncultured Thiodictyon sp.]|uniref:Rpn family recombination-promoting nuclease/putative transposase n=1 Tax=uncultured Thiodictyon sp. TaxID=1846217 RepID=UPI0025D09879|nr:Rpn family recombination-promoting nuclease/putative transposase [uncultured Thiodictyon sp.]